MNFFVELSVTLVRAELVSVGSHCWRLLPRVERYSYIIVRKAYQACNHYNQHNSDSKDFSAGVCVHSIELCVNQLPIFIPKKEVNGLKGFFIDQTVAYKSQQEVSLSGKRWTRHRAAERVVSSKWNTEVNCVQTILTLDVYFQWAIGHFKL